MRFDEYWFAYDTIDGRFVQPGDTVTDFRHDTAEYVGIAALPTETKVGKVSVHWPLNDARAPFNSSNGQVYYPTVFGLQILPTSMCVGCHEPTFYCDCRLDTGD